MALAEKKKAHVDVDDFDFDIIVIGAGLTGLTAARRLAEAGLDILVLEENDTVGGRLLSTEESKYFYAHKLQHRITKLLTNLKIPIIPKQDPMANTTVYFNKEGSTKILPSYASGEIRNFLKILNDRSLDARFKNYKSHEEAPEIAEISVEEYVCKLVFFSQSREVCRGLIYATCGIKDLSSISMLWYLVMLYGAGGFIQRLRVMLGDSNRYFVQGGMMNVAEALKNELIKQQGQVHCSESATKVQFNDDRAYVWTDRSRYKCSYVVIAIPPLEKFPLVIEPELPPNKEMSREIFELGKNIFFTASYENPFWRDVAVSNILALSEKETNLRLACDATNSDDKDVFHLAGFLADHNSNTTQKLTIFEALNAHFKTTEATSFTDYKETGLELIKGGVPMSVLKPGNFTRHIDIINEPHGRVFIAASEFAKHWPGTADGAVEAGEAVASSVLLHARPQAITRLEWTLFRSLARPSISTEPFEIALIHCILLCVNVFMLISFLRAAYQ